MWSIEGGTEKKIEGDTINSPKMKPIQDIDIRELAEIYDQESRDTFLSIYISLTDRNWKRFLESRYNACFKALGDRKEVRANLETSYEKLIEQMEKIPHLPDERGLALFGSQIYDFYRIYPLSVEPSNTFVVDSSPFIKPLALLRDEWEQFLLTYIDGTNASIYLLGARQIKDRKELEKDIMGRHKKGGWSQMRFNRIRKGSIKHFYTDLSSDMSTLIEKERNPVVSIVIAGPGNAKKELEEHLPASLKGMVSHVIDVDSHTGLQDLIASASEIIHQDEKDASMDSVRYLEKLILKDGPAIYGIDEVINASRSGIVEKLLVLKDTGIPGWICEKCQAVEKGGKTKCPYCGRGTSQVEMLEEAIEFVLRSEGEVEFVDESPYLEGLGGIGAILRYRI